MTQPEHNLSEVRAQVHALEQRLLGLPGAWDEPERQALWPELASLNAQLGRADEAAVYWLNALWEADQPQSLIEAWARSELKETSAKLNDEEARAPDLTAQPSERDALKLAAFLLWAASRPRLSASQTQEVQRVLPTFERIERLLPVRAVWLVWHALARHFPDLAQRLPRTAEQVLRRLPVGLDAPAEVPGCIFAAGSRSQAIGDWLLHLHELAQAWIAAHPSAPTSQTPAYTRLLFALGLARLGCSVACVDLRQQAAEALPANIEGHTFLLKAFSYRIDQALEGIIPGGPLPVDQLEELECVDRLERYVVDQLRKCSRLLEPDQRINPYRHWSGRINDFEKALAELTDLTDRKEIADRVEKLLREVPRGPRGNEQRARVLHAGLEASPRVGEEFARKMLDQTIPAYDALPEAREMATVMEQAQFLEKALFVAGHFGRVESVHPLVTRFQRMLQAQSGAHVFQVLDTLAYQAFKGLRKLGMRDEIDQILRQMAELVLKGREVKAIDFKKEEQGPAALRSLLQVAQGWYFFGRDSQAEPILQAARSVLLANDLGPHDQSQLACAYASAVGQGPLDRGQARLEELFRRLGGIRDTYTTASHFSLSQLEVIEAVILAVVSEQGLAQQQLRRWLDENEALIRRRISQDLAVIANGGFAL